jgi:choline dehydrogenase
MKILFDATKKATGVSVNSQGVPYTISATREVIVSAGVFHSPQLLMVSGIGPRPTLESLGIPVISERPGVGQNLCDPISIGVLYNVHTLSGATVAADPANWPALLEQYLEHAAGPYSSAAGHISFEKVPASLRAGFSPGTIAALDSWPSDWPELEYIGGSFPGGGGLSLAAIAASLQKPISRGSVSISSNSMATKPVIDLGWLTDPADAEVAVAGVKRLRQVWASAPANSIKVGAELAPGAAVQTDAEILTYVRNNANQLWHASGTCAMGQASDPMAVVDNFAKVFGVTGLRVVDISAFPFALPAHPQASVYALAEKIADAIKNGN